MHTSTIRGTAEQGVQLDRGPILVSRGIESLQRPRQVNWIVSPQEMRTNVTFRHPAEFVGGQEDGGGILAVPGARWFAALLRRVPGLELDEDLCQEDWGVVIFARRNQKKFWIGLSAWDSEGAWLAHFHHGSFAWLQRFSSVGKKELNRLLADVHDVLASEPAITEIAWHEESEISKPEPAGFRTPVEG